MSASQLPGPGQRALDVLIVDDQLPLLRPAHILAAKEQGTHVIGIWDETSGRGRDYVVELGVDEPLPASTPPAALLQVIMRVGPVNATAEPLDDLLASGLGIFHDAPAARVPRGPAHRRRATITAFGAVSGGTGLSEALIATAEWLSRRRRVLIVEACGTTMAQRLRRAPEYGLAWVLDRLASGHRVLPEGLSPGREDGSCALGASDVICGTATPAGPPAISAVHLGHLLDLATTEYDHVLVAFGSLAAAPAVPGGDRFGVARAILGRSDRVVVFGSADPCGARQLIEWRAAAHRDVDVEAPCDAVFGRASRRRFERAALQDVLACSTGSFPFHAVWFLPEDPAVLRARWDGHLITRGPWFDAVVALASDLGRVGSHRPPPVPRASRRRPAPASRALPS
ncbi:MAG TPA: hypothetical protein VHT30_05180 [Acidimicrobiales bacterium]|jgi:hypothetical protein|nr:hypothetical protein [Acidimicrobiales bacterium]